MARNNTWIYHLVAFATVAIWGCTFVSTKVLMLNGLSPAQIFTLRFLIAYVMMLAVYHSRLWADSWRDELKMMLLGISGGSLYFLSENEAMNFTSTTNTSLIVCSCPLFATLLVRLVYRSTTRISMMQLGGSLLAFAGMVISFLPAGTLSGAPKIRAMEIIDELETVRRGLYGGATGYLDFGGNMNFCITIRTMIKKGDKVYLQAGAGIVADSKPEMEYQECCNKVMALAKTLVKEEHL